MPRVAPEIRRQNIIDAALALFRERGYENVRVDDILASTGLSKGGFYHHFKSKDDILRRIVAQETATLAGEVSQESASGDAMSGLAALFRRASIDLGASMGVLHSLGSFASRSVYLDELERQLAQHLKPLLISLIDRGIRDRTFAEVDPEASAELLMAVNDHGNRSAILGSLSSARLQAYNRTALQALATHLGIGEKFMELIQASA